MVQTPLILKSYRQQPPFCLFHSSFMFQTQPLSTKFVDEMQRTLEMNHIAIAFLKICLTKTSVKFTYIFVQVVVNSQNFQIFSESLVYCMQNSPSITYSIRPDVGARGLSNQFSGNYLGCTLGTKLQLKMHSEEFFFFQNHSISKGSSRRRSLSSVRFNYKPG